MAHIFEPAPNSRAKCRGCGARIDAGTPRFGERLPNPFADDGGEMTHWFHIKCAAFKRPEPVLEALAAGLDPGSDREHVEREAKLGVEHRRLPRANTAERASSGRATCRSCREVIPKDAWRISLVFYEDGRFQPSGFIHARCAAPFFETTEVMERMKHFTPALSGEDLAAISAEVMSWKPGDSENQDKSEHGERET